MTYVLFPSLKLGNKTFDASRFARRCKQRQPQNMANITTLSIQVLPFPDNPFRRIISFQTFCPYSFKNLLLPIPENIDERSLPRILWALLSIGRVLKGPARRRSMPVNTGPYIPCLLLDAVSAYLPLLSPRTNPILSITYSSFPTFSTVSSAYCTVLFYLRTTF